MNKRLLIAIGVAGIVLELIAIALMAARVIGIPIAIPIMIAGLLLGMVPMFALSRASRR